MTKLRPFVLLQAASLSSVISGSATFIAVPWLALHVTHSSTLAALVIAASAVPGLLFTPFVGGLVDRFGRRRVAFWSELFIAVTSALIPIVALTIGMNLPMLIILVVLKALMPGGQPARKSLLPDVAEHGAIPIDRANSVNEAIGAAGFAVGPSVAAMLIWAFDSYAAFWAAAAFSLVSAVLVLFIHVVEKQEAVEGDPESSHPIRYAMQGFVALGRIPALLVVFFSFIVLAIIYIPTEMVVLPRYYQGIGQPQMLGWLITEMSTFTVLGSLMFERIHKWIGYSNIVRIAGITIGAAMIPMSLLPPFWVMLVCGAFLGLVWGPMMPLLNTLIQTMVPANLRGRVFSVEIVMWNTAPLTSFIVVGLALDAFGVQPVYMALAILVFIASVGVALAPQLNDLSDEYKTSRA